MSSSSAVAAEPSFQPRVIARWLLTLTMFSMGALHFIAGNLFVQMVPPSLPAPYALVWISGVFEALLALGLVFERTRQLAGWGLMALFVAVFPANIYMAMANLQMQGLPSWLIQPSQTALWLRLPLQAGFIFWAWFVSRPVRD